MAILHSLADAHAGRVVLASTCAVYGEQAEQPISETTPVAPSSPMAEASSPPTQTAADLATTGAIGAISLRAFNVAGAHLGHPDRNTTWLILQLLAVQQGHAPELVINGDGTAVRDFVHVADMAAAFALALRACEPGTWRAYNVGSGRPSTVHDVITTAETVSVRYRTTRPATAHHHHRARARDTAGRQHPHADRAGLRLKRLILPEIIADAWSALTSK